MEESTLCTPVTQVIQLDLRSHPAKYLIRSIDIDAKNTQNKHVRLRICDFKVSLDKDSFAFAHLNA
jgi:hypothetical protein